MLTNKSYSGIFVAHFQLHITLKRYLNFGHDGSAFGRGADCRVHSTPGSRFGFPFKSTKPLILLVSGNWYQTYLGRIQ